VYEDGKKTVTLKGDHIAEEFQALLDAYVLRTYGGQDVPRTAAELAEPVERKVIPVVAA
jgi:hypothetical protein